MGLFFFFFLNLALKAKRPYLCGPVMYAHKILVEGWCCSEIVQEPEMTTKVIMVSWIKVYFVPASDMQ